MATELTRAKQQALGFLQTAAGNLLTLCQTFDNASGKMVGAGLASAPGTIGAGVFADQQTAPPYVAGDFGPAGSVFSHLSTADVTALYAALTTLRSAVTPQTIALLQKWAP